MNPVFFNNRYIPLERAKISILDRGFLYGDGIFESMRSYGDVIFRLEEHIDRLYRGISKIGMKIEFAKPELCNIVNETLARNRKAKKRSNFYVKIIVTRRETGFLLMPSNKRGMLIVYTLPFKNIHRRIYRNGMRLRIARAAVNECSILQNCKSLNYLQNICYKIWAVRAGFDDAVLLNTKGFVAETTSSNIFMVKDKKLFTPSVKSGILEGITRAEVIDIAKRDMHIDVKEQLINPEFLYSADEIFLTNSIMEIAPVTAVEKKVIKNRKPGSVTKELLNLYKKRIRKYVKEGC